MSEWPAEPMPWVLSILAAAAYALAWRSVNRAHPASPMPTWRLVAWLGGVLSILVALASPLDVLADDLLSAHMIQHLVLVMVAPPLLALGAPVLLALRALPPRLRSQVLLPVLHSRPLRVAGSPLVGWLLFTILMWAVHFTPIYEAALEDERIHVIEHLVLLASGCLFWWPVIAADPMPGRLGHGPRLVYLLTQMPVNAVVGLAIYFAPSVLYVHYTLTAPGRGLAALTDQQVGGLLMWAIGDFVLLCAVGFVVAAWMRADARRVERREAQGQSQRMG
jgi:putative copper resistance protein D